MINCEINICDVVKITAEMKSTQNSLSDSYVILKNWRVITGTIIVWI